MVVVPAFSRIAMPFLIHVVGYNKSSARRHDAFSRSVGFSERNVSPRKK
jgi:hypothetical protein